MRQEINARFKQATIKDGNATLQFEVLPTAKGFVEIMKLTGGVVMLAVETEQEKLPLEEGVNQATINNYFVNADTGEVEEYEAEVIDYPDLPEGGEE